MQDESTGLEKLLAVVDAIEDEEEILVQFTSAAWSDTSLELGLSITLSDSEAMFWRVRCEVVLGYLLRKREAFWIELTDDHPLLWDFKNESAAAFFLGTPADPESAVGALYEAHRNAVDSWIGFERYLHGSSELLASGGGLLAGGPVPILEAYKEALRPHGVQVSICSAQAPSFWDGTIYRELRPEDNPKALLMGDSYVVGIGWTARQEP